MRVAEAFKDIFGQDTVEELDSVWNIHETRVGATFNLLQVNNPGESFFVINPCLYSQNVCHDDTGWLNDKNCDGAALTRNSGIDYIILVELKSTLDSTKIITAYEQIVQSFVKLQMMLSICQGYDMQNYDLIGVIACKPAKNKDQEIKFHQELLNIKEGNFVPPDMACLVRLYFDSYIECYLADTPFMKGHAFHKDFQYHKIRIYLKMADAYSDDSVAVDFVEFQKQHSTGAFM